MNVQICVCVYVCVPLYDYISKGRNLKQNRLTESRGKLLIEGMYEMEGQENQGKKIDCTALY